jgi:nucleoside-diphosphate-sugar epimerase
VNALVPAGLRVAVTGPTGDIGRSLLRALEREPGVSQVVAMARRRFNPSELALTKTEYHRGDVLDRVAVDELVSDADVVVHLAFLTVAGREETDQINLDGSRTVFEAAVEAGASRLVYASHPSSQKATLEAALHEIVADSATDAYVFRPSIVAGADALALLQNIPYVALSELLRRYENPLTTAVRDALGRFPNLKPVLPDPGTSFQLVHHDDVADAFVLAVLGRGEPGAYDLAAPPPLRVSELAAQLGWYSFPMPESAVESLAELIARLPLLPAQAQWIETLRQPVLMDTTKARERLGFSPRHDGRETLQEMVQAAREKGLLQLG